ncbi:multicopper oxidase domain-containing protein [Fictibacillus barbaricus]|uniref:multicopper oxidase domain-containing protein n=1 Tax=Fictibacillus barbaricus TaxID=182136 RepID=UPI0035A21C24
MPIKGCKPTRVWFTSFFNTKYYSSIAADDKQGSIRREKDTVRANPKQVARIIMKFGPYTGLYFWHCHILKYEDYEMMKLYMVIR